MLSLCISCDSLARAAGADQVAEALTHEAAQRNLPLRIKRTSSRGLYWLEPLVELDTAQGRLGFGPVALEDIPGLLDALAGDHAGHALALGPVEDIPYLKTQQRLLFARAGITRPLSLDDYHANGGFEGCARPRCWTATKWSRRCLIRACVAEVARPSRRASSGAPCARRRPRRSTWCATPTRATLVPSPTVC